MSSIKIKYYDQEAIINILREREPRVVIGFNEDSCGRAVVTTGVPRQYKEGQITYVDQKTVSYEDYITSKFQQSYGRRK